MKKNNTFLSLSLLFFRFFTRTTNFLGKLLLLFFNFIFKVKLLKACNEINASRDFVGTQMDG